MENKENNNIIRLSISEAAKFFGVNAQTIRRGIKSGEIRYVVVSNRYKLNFESLLKWSQKRKTTQGKLASKGIGQFVERWKIKNTLYSPNPKALGKAAPDKSAPTDDNQKTA